MNIISNVLLSQCFGCTMIWLLLDFRLEINNKNHPCLHSSIHPSTYPSIYAFIYPSINLSIILYLSILHTLAIFSSDCVFISLQITKDKFQTLYTHTHTHNNVLDIIILSKLQFSSINIETSIHCIHMWRNIVFIL